MDWKKLDRCMKLYSEADAITTNHMRPFYEEHGINYLKCSILGQIADNSVMTLNLLSKNLGKAATNLSVVVTNMEEEGYIIRVRSRNDGRIAYFNLTDKGRKMLDEVCMYAANVYGNIFEDESEIDDLIIACENYLEKLKSIA